MITSVQLQWLESLFPYVKQAKDCWPLMRPSVCLAQAIQETGWGKACIGWDLWGIKKLGGHGSVNVPTHEFVVGVVTPETDAFANLETPEEGFAAYSKLGSESDYYAAARACVDLEGYVRALAAHWATDPAYADHLLAIIRGHGLEFYDA